MNLFLRSHKVISVQKTLHEIDGAPRWCFCVEYLDGGRPEGGSRGQGRSKRIDYKAVLSEEDFAVYARLRDTRKELATAEAVPIYAVCTNEQLSLMAQERPDSLASLKSIDGFGEAKAGKYGKALIASIGEQRKADHEASGQSD